MAMRRVEEPHYTVEQIKEHVREARLVASELDLSEAETALLLPAIFEKLSSKQIMLEQVGNLPNMVIPKGLG